MKRFALYLLALTFGSIYAVLLSSDEGKAWIDENTTVGVVLGVGGVLMALRLGLDGRSWKTVAATFGAAGAPLVVRGVMRRMAE
jgi:hypothetical protein